MKQVRKSLFETNSSSTHAVCVSRTMCDVEPRELYSWGDDYCFGRCESYLVESWSAKMAYAYIVVEDLHGWESVKERRDTSNDVDNFIKMLYDVAKDYFIDPKDEFESHSGFTQSNFMHMLEDIKQLAKEYNAYVDHTEDFATNGFYDRLVTDKEFIRRLVFNPDSYITVGGDEYRGYNIKTIGFEHDYDSDYVPHEAGDDSWYARDPRERYVGDFWTKLKEYEKDFEVFLKGN